MNEKTKLIIEFILMLVFNFAIGALAGYGFICLTSNHTH